jgi:rare lipoprotein A
MVRITAFILFVACFLPSVAQQMEQHATYYHNRFEHRKTSTGEVFSQKKYTAAHKTLPLNTFVRVTNKINGRSVIVKINDRCPRPNVIDMSLIAAKRILVHKTGTSKVVVEVLNDDYEAVWEKQDDIFQMLDRIEFDENYAVVESNKDSGGFKGTFLFLYYIKILDIEDEQAAKDVISKFSAYLRSKCTTKMEGERYFIYLGGFFTMDNAIETALLLKFNYSLSLEVKRNG